MSYLRFCNWTVFTRHWNIKQAHLRSPHLWNSLAYSNVSGAVLKGEHGARFRGAEAAVYFRADWLERRQNPQPSSGSCKQSVGARGLQWTTQILSIWSRRLHRLRPTGSERQCQRANHHPVYFRTSWRNEQETSWGGRVIRGLNNKRKRDGRLKISAKRRGERRSLRPVTGSQNNVAREERSCSESWWGRKRWKMDKVEKRDRLNNLSAG